MDVRELRTARLGVSLWNTAPTKLGSNWRLTILSATLALGSDILQGAFQGEANVVWIYKTSKFDCSGCQCGPRTIADGAYDGVEKLRLR